MIVANRTTDRLPLPQDVSILSQLLQVCSNVLDHIGRDQQRQRLRLASLQRTIGNPTAILTERPLLDMAKTASYSQRATGGPPFDILNPYMDDREFREALDELRRAKHDLHTSQKNLRRDDGRIPPEAMVSFIAQFHRFLNAHDAVRELFRQLQQAVLEQTHAVETEAGAEPTDQRNLLAASNISGSGDADSGDRPSSGSQSNNVTNTDGPFDFRRFRLHGRESDQVTPKQFPLICLAWEEEQKPMKDRTVWNKKNLPNGFDSIEDMKKSLCDVNKKLSAKVGVRILSRDKRLCFSWHLPKPKDSAGEGESGSKPSDNRGKKYHYKSVFELPPEDFKFPK